jgi:membrane-bound lytic murein transglycosylase MltF
MRLAIALLTLLVWAILPPRPARPADELLAHVEKPWTGDLDQMIKRRRVRVLVVYSKTFYFLDRGRQRGTTYDTMRAFEDELNRRLGTGQLKVQVFFIPVGRDELLPGLVEGRGDIAAANLTITDERRQQVAFSDPLITGVDEVVVTGPASPAIASTQDLSGQEVFVRKSSSYYESLVRLNAELQKAGKPAVRLKLAPEALEDEDLLEMVNAGLVRLVVVDSHKAEFWAKIFPKIRLHPEAALRTDGAIAWAFRKGSPKLRAAVNRFVATHKLGTSFGNQVFTRYLRSTKFVKNALDPEEIAKYERTVTLFRKYGEQYDFDWLMLTPRGTRSPSWTTPGGASGAVGVMQVLPRTGKEMRVGTSTSSARTSTPARSTCAS